MNPSTLAAHAALHFIDGKDVPSLSGRTFETVNPATGEPLGTVAFGEAADVDRAVNAAWQAFKGGAWAAGAPATRATCLRRIATSVRDNRERIATLDALDAGKPIADARNDVDAAAGLLDYASSLPENTRGHVYAREAGHFSYSRREPYGVVGAIAPWNFPFLNAVAKTAIPLAAGNCVVLKMAEQTPLSTSLYAQICHAAGLPPGVLNVVHGDGPTTGAALAAHPHVPKLTFTGSTEVGRKILTAAARSIKSSHLELGGKSPNIVLPDADLDRAAAGSLFTSFWNAGQVCSSGSRLLVHDRVADAFVATLARRARTLVVGDPLRDSTRVGPLVSAEQHKRVGSYVAAGLDEGATLATGGESLSLPPPHERGFFAEPTIFIGVKPDMTIAQEEIFGPVLSVLSFHTDEEAIELANNVAYGLAATVWTNRLDAALRFADRLEAGIVWTNCPHDGAWQVPYEGHKQSGLGEDGGLEAIGTFTKLKVNHISTTRTPAGW